MHTNVREKPPSLPECTTTLQYRRKQPATISSPANHTTASGRLDTTATQSQAPHHRLVTLHTYTERYRKVPTTTPGANNNSNNAHPPRETRRGDGLQHRLPTAGRGRPDGADQPGHVGQLPALPARRDPRARARLLRRGRVLHAQAAGQEGPVAGQGQEVGGVEREGAHGRCGVGRGGGVEGEEWEGEEGEEHECAV